MRTRAENPLKTSGRASPCAPRGKSEEIAPRLIYPWGHAPSQDIPSRARFITEPQLPYRSQLLNQLSKRLYPVRYDTQRSHLSILLGNRNGNRRGMDIQINKFYSFYRPAPFLVALYCLSTDSQHDPRPRIVAGHSILTSRHDFPGVESRKHPAVIDSRVL